MCSAPKLIEKNGRKKQERNVVNRFWCLLSARMHMHTSYFNGRVLSEHDDDALFALLTVSVSECNAFMKCACVYSILFAGAIRTILSRFFMLLEQ